MYNIIKNNNLGENTFKILQISMQPSKKKIKYFSIEL